MKNQIASQILELIYVGIDSWGRLVYEDENGRLWKYTEPGEMPQERHDMLYTSTNNALYGEPCLPMPSHIDYRIKEGF